MEVNQINMLLDDLAWTKPKEIRENAMSKLIKLDDDQIPLLIQEYGKTHWHNAVDVIKNIGYPRNIVAIPRLIWLLQDFNWPGVKTAMEMLEGIDTGIIIPHIEEALKKAANNGDFMWIGGIKRLVERLKIVKGDFSEKEVYDILELADW